VTYETSEINIPECENPPFWPLEKHPRNKPGPYRKQAWNVKETRYRKH